MPKKTVAWSMVLARDEAYEPESNEDHLKGLEWLIGDWKLDAKGQPLTIRFEWLAQKNFIKNTYVGHQGRSSDSDRRPNHRLESEAGSHRFLALRRQRRFRH